MSRLDAPSGNVRAGSDTAAAIAVVIPLYNRERSIGSTIQSVLDQRFKNFEVLVVDDCSTDDSAAIVEAFADPRVRLLRHPARRGGNSARNLGIRASTAPIISFLDSDDRFYPTKFERVLALLDARRDVDAVIDSHCQVYPDERKPRLRINPEIEGRDIMLDALFRRRLWKATPGITVRREAAFKAGLFNEELRRRQDYEFLIRLIECAHVVSSSQVNWEKTCSDDRLTSFEGFVPTAIDFWARHPSYQQHRGFRRGFAADVTGHWLKEVLRGRFAQLLRERALLAERAGELQLSAFLSAGLLELLRLRAHRRTLQARTSSVGREDRSTS